MLGRSIATALALVAMPAAASAGETCVAGAPFVGAPLRVPLAASVLPAHRPLSTAAMPPALAAELDASFDELLAKTSATSAGVAMWKPGVGYWTRSAGLTSDGPQSFWWASTGKLVTATVVLQLVDEGKLALDTPVRRFFPDFERASVATIDDLLRHTSGIFSFNADRRLRASEGYKRPEELIAVAERHPLDFCPGTNWNYSNTGYVMLARIVEQVEARSFAEIVRTRVTDPLGLTSLRVLSRDDPAAAVVPLRRAASNQVADIATVFGAGAIVATPSDMLALLHGWVEGDLITSARRAAALDQLHPMFGTTMFYGQGVMVTDVPDAKRPTTWIGHSGGSPDAKGLVLYDTRRDLYVAMALNDQAPAEAIANVLLKVMEDYRGRSPS